ncbi:MAG: outer membrane protein assembly factor BamE [Rickettsiales bacterium]
MIKKVLSSIALIAALSGCAKEYYHHGYSFEQNNVALIKVGQANEDLVLRELGSPTSKSKTGGLTYYYIESTSEKLAFLDPKIIEQRVLTIAFDDKGVVKAIKENSLNDANDIAFSEDLIEIKGNTLSPIEQIFSNIGKFNKKEQQF